METTLNENDIIETRIDNEPIYAHNPDAEYTIQSITKRGWEDCCEPCSRAVELIMEIDFLRDQWDKDGSHRTIGDFNECHRIKGQDGAIYKRCIRTTEGFLLLIARGDSECGSRKLDKLS